MLRRFHVSIRAFFETPASPVPLAVFRIMVAAIVLIQSLSLHDDLLRLFGSSSGLIQSTISSKLVVFAVPRVEWIAGWLGVVGVSEAACLKGLFAIKLIACCLVLIGYNTRASAVILWLTNLTLKTTASASIYGVDEFLHIALFYCVVFPVGNVLSMDWILASCTYVPSLASRLGVRVIQVHLCIVYLTSGIEKASGIQWWNGEAIWRVLMREDFGINGAEWISAFPWLAATITISTLIIEVGYAAAVWIPASRRPWVWATIGMHLGIAFAMGLYSFGATMCAWNFAAFIVDAEPRRRTATVAYDGECGVCRWILLIMHRVAPRVFHSIGRAHERVALLKGRNVKQAMVVVANDRVAIGAKGFLWMVAIGTGIPELSAVGSLRIAKRVYQWFAIRRHRFGCDLGRGKCS